MAGRGSTRVRLQWHGDEALKRLEAAANKGLTEYAIVVAGTAERSFGREHGGIPSKPGMPPHSQSGHLRNSIAYVPAKNLKALVGTNVPYGRHLEFGFTARAKRAKFLAVPVHPKASRALVRAGGRTRNIPGLVLIRTKAGQLLLVKPIKGKHARVEVWFVLKKSVTVAPRPWLRPALARSRAEGLRRMHAAVAREMAKGGAA